MKLIPVVVAYHSAPWMRVLVRSYLRHFPEDRLLVIDNNPRPGMPTWQPHCEQERSWLAQHPHVLLVDNPEAGDRPWVDRTHGAGVDLAVAWCRAHGVDVLIHLEPDCLITGRQWRANLERALAGGAWMAGSHRKRYGPIHPTPSAWRVTEIRCSFRVQPMGADKEHPRFHELLDMEIYRTDLAPGLWPSFSNLWDTGLKAWFDAAVHDRAALVAGPDCQHYWQGSTARRLAAGILAERFPELCSYLLGNFPDEPHYTVESCPFREAQHALARCTLLRQLSAVEDANLCSVQRDACSACCASFPPAPGCLNPVVAALLYGLTETILARGGVPGCTARRAAELQRQAEQNLEVEDIT